MECKLKGKENICYICKKICTVLPENIKKCNYHIRQHPKKKEIYDNKFKKALKKALKKRDIFEKYSLVSQMYKINYDLSIFENVNNCLSGIKPPSFKIENRSMVAPEKLKGNILENIVSNLYVSKKINILQKDENKDTLIIEKDNHKYLCKTKKKVKDFLSQLQSSRNKTKVFRDQIIEEIPL